MKLTTRLQCLWLTVAGRVRDAKAAVAKLGDLPMDPPLVPYSEAPAPAVPVVLGEGSLAVSAPEDASRAALLRPVGARCRALMGQGEI